MFRRFFELGSIFQKDIFNIFFAAKMALYAENIENKLRDLYDISDVPSISTN